MLQVIGQEKNKHKLNTFSKNLILWHKENGRHDLPWQINISPYKVWISEVMLQQTQVKTVLPYYKEFIQKYPNIKSLSNSNLDDILESWSGLGYYRRAQNIYKSSQILKSKYKYEFPKLYDDILELPGIGRSTAGAILALAYNKKYPILDGNVKRVIKRYFAVTGEKNNEKNLWNISESLLPSNNNNVYTQSIMDLGSLICTKNIPLCKKCPVSINCDAFRLNLMHSIPEKKQKLKHKKLKLYLLLIQDYKEKNLILMKKNPKDGIWSNLWNLPSFNNIAEYKKFLEKNNMLGKVFNYYHIDHKLTHLKLDINVLKIVLSKKIDQGDYYWKNIYDKIGSAKPVIMTIKKLKEELD